ncbi:unnamed protein product [Ectocarpus sp. 8 AP-2014]
MRPLLLCVHPLTIQRAVYSPLSGSKNAPQGDTIKTLLDMYADVGTPIGRFSLESGLGFDFSPSSGANHSVQSAITVDSPATAGSSSSVVGHDDDGDLHQEDEQEQQGEGPTSVPSPPLPSSGAVAVTDDDDAAYSVLLAITDILDDVPPTLVVSPLPLNSGNNGFGGSDFWETSVIRELRDGPIFSTGGPNFNTTTTERLLLSDDDDGDEPPFSGYYSVRYYNVGVSVCAL